MTALWLLIGVVLGALATWSASRLRQGREREEQGRSDARTSGSPRGGAGLVADLGRDLRPPLQSIQEHIDRALVEGDASIRNRTLRVAARQARRAARVAEKSELFARLQAGALETRLQDLDVGRYLDMLVSSFEEVADRRGLTLEFVARPGTIPGRTDPEHLTTIVSNLMSSAIRNTASGGRLGVAVEKAPDSGEESAIRIVVTDTGSADVQERSEAVHMLREGTDDGLAPRPGTSALNLSLAHGLTRLLGGEMSVEVSGSGGARFVVELPLPGPAQPLLGLDEDATKRSEITDEILFRTTEAVDGMEAPETPPTFLTVQTTAARPSLTAALRALGTVIVATDAEMALALAREHVPDVIVADPMEGERELARRLAADERTSHILFLPTGDDRRDPADVAEAALELLRQRDDDREQFRQRAVLRRSKVVAASVDQEFVDQVVSVIEDRLGDNDFSVPELADAVALSTSQLTRKLRSLLGQTPGKLIRRLRLERGRDLLESDAGSVGRIAFSLGFADQAHFTRSFKQAYGVTPSDFRRSSQASGPGVSIGRAEREGAP